MTPTANPATTPGGHDRLTWPLAAILGMVLAAAPHALQWWATSDPTYFADGDGLLYHTWLREALFHGRPWMVDGIHDGRTPMMHPWLLFVPPALLAHALGGTPFLLGLVFRLIAGAGLSLGLLAVVRSRVRAPWLAAGIATWLLFDSGLLFGQILQRPLQLLLELSRGDRSVFQGVPMLMPHLRVVTPSLALAILLVHYAAVLRARSAGETGKARVWVAVAAVSLAALIHAYFYLWTMVVLGAALAALLDPGGRRVYLAILVAGLLLGSPFLIENALIKGATSPDWLLRTAKFVPIPRLSELLFPRILIVEWLAAGWLVWRRRDLTYLWTAVGAGLFLLNHQLVTGLQIENDHWTLAYGTTFSLLLALLVAPATAQILESRPASWGRFLQGLLVLHVLIGLTFRGLEVKRSVETNAVNQRATWWRNAQWRLPPGSVVAGDPEMLFAGAAQSTIRPLSCRLIEFSSAADDAELDERLFLNLYLRGVPREDAKALARRPPGTLSWEAHAVRDPAVAARQRDRRLALVDAIWDDPGPRIKRYGVTHLMLNIHLKEEPPPGLPVFRDQIGGEHWLFQLR